MPTNPTREQILAADDRNQVFAFEVSVPQTGWSRIVNARTAGKAKYEYWLDATDSWPDLPFTSIRVRKVGPPQSSPEFIANAKYRGIPDVRCGQRVSVLGSKGVIVGHGGSANLVVLFDEDDPKRPGMRLIVHPAEIEGIQQEVAL